MDIVTERPFVTAATVAAAAIALVMLKTKLTQRRKEGKGKPPLVVLVCGKRKSGKDYIVELLAKRVGLRQCEVLHLSGPLKKQYALEHNLDYAELMSASAYKEKYRADMIRWGEEKRRKDPGFFARCAEEACDPAKVWIVGDCRRPTDFQYFQERYNCISIRVQASDETRHARGWEFATGVDDADSECAVDQIRVTYTVPNNKATGHDPAMERVLQRVYKDVMVSLCS